MGIVTKLLWTPKINLLWLKTLEEATYQETGCEKLHLVGHETGEVDDDWIPVSPHCFLSYLSPKLCADISF
jgi:hypothetical protein